MTPEKISQTIKSAVDDEPLLAAFTALLEQSFDGEQTAALGPQPDPHIRAYDCGRASALKDVLDEVKRIRGK